VIERLQTLISVEASWISIPGTMFFVLRVLGLCASSFPVLPVRGRVINLFLGVVYGIFPACCLVETYESTPAA